MVEEDCVAFLRATTAGHAQGVKPDCPTCPPSAPAPEVLQIDHVQIDQFLPADKTCTVSVQIFATFKPSAGGEIVGGLTGWITPDQKARYARGETPVGQQIYPVKALYRRTPKGWRVVEFN